jgi:hypothetical protein
MNPITTNMSELLNHMESWCLVDINSPEDLDNDVQRGISKGWISHTLAEQWFGLDDTVRAELFYKLKSNWQETAL